MREYKSLSHAKWYCKYHVVFIPKYQKKTIYGPIRQYWGQIFRDLASYKEGVAIEEGHLQADHVHMCLNIPLKYAISTIVGYLKGKGVIMIARQFRGRERNFMGENFWARGYFVSTVGLDEVMVRAYIRNQEEKTHGRRR